MTVDWETLRPGDLAVGVDLFLFKEPCFLGFGLFIEPGSAGLGPGTRDLVGDAADGRQLDMPAFGVGITTWCGSTFCGRFEGLAGIDWRVLEP